MNFTSRPILHSSKIPIKNKAYSLLFDTTDARAAMDNFKMEAASEVGVNLKEGYSGHLTSREAGSVGGQMVKQMRPAQTMKYQRADRTTAGHMTELSYITSVTF